MFQWYKNSAKCYAYLPDILTKEREGGDENPPLAWEQDFERSTWFERGWTLQELLAPKHVEFFDRGGISLGTKTSLRDIISSVTHIPTDVLCGQNFNRYSIAQKMSWAAGRKTTRGEDLAYCLMGLFGVNMPLLYGEGFEKAFLRLQQEIIKDSADDSIFAWKDEKRYAVHGLLAPSPAAFTDSCEIVPIRSPRRNIPFAMTQLCLRCPTKRLSFLRHGFALPFG